MNPRSLWQWEIMAAVLLERSWSVSSAQVLTGKGQSLEGWLCLMRGSLWSSIQARAPWPSSSTSPSWGLQMLLHPDENWGGHTIKSIMLTLPSKRYISISMFIYFFIEWLTWVLTSSKCLLSYKLRHYHHDTCFMVIILFQLTILSIFLKIFICQCQLFSNQWNSKCRQKNASVLMCWSSALSTL